jgi:hypothetical protein
MSSDGRFVAFLSNGNPTTGPDTNGAVTDVFLRDMQAGVTTLASTRQDFTQTNSPSNQPALSADGHYIAWISAGIFDGQDTNGLPDVIARATLVPTITSVSPTSITRGTTTTLTINGTNFMNPPLVTVGFGGAGVTVNSATWVSATKVTASVTVDASVDPGAVTVELMNQGTGMGQLSGGGAQCQTCLTVK